MCSSDLIKYDTVLQDPFMVVFFTTIGIGSSISALKKGGKLLIIFWVLSGIMTFMQTVIGVGIAKVTNIHPLYGVLAGSVSMSGGHGSAGAFGKTVEQLGVTGASTMALSSATFGLLAGGLLGDPLALYLIRKHKLKAINIVGKDEINFEEQEIYQNITADELLKHIAVLSILLMFCIVGALFALSSPQQQLLLENSPGGEMMGGAMVQLAFNLGNAVGALCGGLVISKHISVDYTALEGAGFVLLAIIIMLIFIFTIDRSVIEKYIQKKRS